MELTKDLLAKLPLDLPQLGEWIESPIATHHSRMSAVLAWNLTIAALLCFAGDRADARWLKANL